MDRKLIEEYIRAKLTIVEIEAQILGKRPASITIPYMIAVEMVGRNDENKRGEW